MDCKKAQRLYDDLTGGRLPETQAAELRRHVMECTDCRVAQQRAARLQQLLAVKRYEQPAPAYFQNFLTDFHRRLDAEDARPTLWERLVNALTIEATPAWRYGLATVAGVLVVAGLLWRPNVAPREVAVVPVAQPAPVRLAATEPMALPVASREPSAPRYVLDHISVTPVSYEPGTVRF